MGFPGFNVQEARMFVAVRFFKFCRLSFAALLLSSSGIILAAPLVITYPGPASTADTRANYYVNLLDLALSKTGADYKLKPYTVIATGSRVLQDLQQGRDIDLTWGPTTATWEKETLPVRVPLDKGILGWRLFLVNKSDLPRFAQVHTMEQLKAYSAGLQHDWGDVVILRANGLPVVDASVYETMFQMLALHRFQYFPRGVGEIEGEAQRFAKLGLVVEPTLALHYPSQTYFFVSPRNKALHDLIERGLQEAMRDGSFDKLFDKFNGQAMKDAHLDTRTVFELTVPEQ